MASEHNSRIDSVEFGTTDLPATKAFYERVFGWSFTDYGPDYTSFADGRLSGGFRADAPPKAPLIVLYAADLEATRKAVVDAGARAFGDHAFPGGRRFHFEDPGGNELAVWTDR